MACQRDVAIFSISSAGDLDTAIIDRMDEALEFPLPSESERRQIISLYLEQYISAAGTAEGGAGTAAPASLWARFSAMLRGRKAGTDRIQRSAGMCSAGSQCLEQCLEEYIFLCCNLNLKFLLSTSRFLEGPFALCPTLQHPNTGIQSIGFRSPSQKPLKSQ